MLIPPYPVDEIAAVKNVHVNFQSLVAAAYVAGDEATFKVLMMSMAPNFESKAVRKVARVIFFADEAAQTNRPMTPTTVVCAH